MREKDLVDTFERYLLQTYPKVDVYNHHETGYGKCGHPDIEVKIQDIYSTLFVECKKAQSFEKAVSDLRPQQRGRILEMLQAKSVIFLLYDGGCAQASPKLGEINWKNYIDGERRFTAFETLYDLIKQRERSHSCVLGDYDEN